MIPGDIAAALGVRASGTWRPAPAGAGGAPGTYATSVAFRLADAAGRTPGEVAAGLAARLEPVPWISAASVTRGGYLTVTVTPEALAGLAVRVPAAGAACADSDALRGTEVAAPAADLASAASWAEARRRLAAEISGRLAAAAGAKVKVNDHSERGCHFLLPALAGAVAFAGPDAVRYALARTQPGRQAAIDAAACARNDLGNPFFAVRYAHAHAASVARWAADLGVDRGRPETFRPDLLGHPGERELLGVLSWLPERAAAAARRRRPDAFARYLEGLAAAWLGCWERCPALPFGGRSAPTDVPRAAARLWLAAAAQTALRTGMGLLGMAAPERLHAAGSGYL
ncbi:MAG TPA: DALR anticodon-binding domain-containing protein [Streptosporangiaceae bacterium]|nr:DALR anticodon-binding domain-containing protein [Streptosporangiaceae bacterium]